MNVFSESETGKKFREGGKREERKGIPMEVLKHVGTSVWQAMECTSKKLSDSCL